MTKIIEKDWKLMRSMKKELLNKACEQILVKVEKLIKDQDQSAHEKYLKLWKQIKEEDKIIAIMFDDLRRSNAILKLSNWYGYELLSDKQLNQFTENTQKTIRAIIEIMK